MLVLVVEVEASKHTALPEWVSQVDLAVGPWRGLALILLTPAARMSVVLVMPAVILLFKDILAAPVARLAPVS